MFWHVLGTFNQPELRLFLRLVWGQSRLPAATAAWGQKFEIMDFQWAGGAATVDIALPKSHTCFFQLELPKYSTREIMREKLLCASSLPSLSLSLSLCHPLTWPERSLSLCALLAACCCWRTWLRMQYTVPSSFGSHTVHPIHPPVSRAHTHAIHTDACANCVGIDTDAQGDNAVRNGDDAWAS